MSRRTVIGFGTAVGSTALLNSVAAAMPACRAEKSRGNAILGSGGLHHVGLMTRDWERTLAFYQNGFGFSVKTVWSDAPNRMGVLDSGDGTCLEIYEDLTFNPRSGDASPDKFPEGVLVHFCLHTSRLDAVFEHVRRVVNARVLVEPTTHTLKAILGRDWGPTRYCIVEGPSGEWVELLQELRPE